MGRKKGPTVQHDPNDPFASFLAARPGGLRAKVRTWPVPDNRGPWNSTEPHVAEAMDITLGVASPSKTASFEHLNPYSTFMGMRPKPKPAPMGAVEQSLREDILRTKKQLLEVAVLGEIRAQASPRAEESASQVKSMRRAMRYKKKLERVMDAMSNCSDDSDDSPEVASAGQRPSSKGSGTRPSTRGSANGGGSKRSLGGSASAPALRNSPCPSLPPIEGASDGFGGFVMKEKTEPVLSGWWTGTRTWNTGVGKRKENVKRMHTSLFGGCVVVGNGKIPCYSGAHLLNPGYFFQFQIDELEAEPGSRQAPIGMSAAFGVTTLHGRDPACERPMYAYEMPDTVTVGYGGSFIDCKRWRRTPWNPSELQEGDIVGILVTNDTADMVVYVNGEQKCRFPTFLSQEEAEEGKRTLYPVVDLCGAVCAVSLQPRSAPPNIPLECRSRLR